MGKKELKITVININNITLEVKCTIYNKNYENNTIPPNQINNIFSNSVYTYIFSYYDDNTITHIEISARYSNYSLYGQKRYTFSGHAQDIIAVIDSNNTIQIFNDVIK
ncbi:MAG: hypothetical protein V1726_07315 [Methanobacteriota archaeon]